MSELSRSPLSGPMLAAYRFFWKRGRRKAARRIMSLAFRLEGGQMRSATARDIMRELHGVEIGAHSYGCFDPERFPPGIRVGRYVSIGPDVRVFRRNHPLEHLSLHPYFYNPALGLTGTTAIESYPLEIGHDCWIGAASIILPGSRSIGQGAVIGAGSVVTRDVPELAVAAGNPARVLKQRFSDELSRAVSCSRWWELEPQGLAARLPEMQAPLHRGHSLLAMGERVQ